MILAGIGWVLGLILTIIEGNPFGGTSLIDPPEHVVHAFFTLAQTTLLVVASWPLFATLRRLRPYLSGNRFWIGAPLLILALAAFSPLLIPPIEGTPQAVRSPRVLALHSVSGVFGLLGIGGMWLVDAAARTLGWRRDPLEIGDFQCLKGDLSRLLTILAAVIGLVTLATGAYRYALLSSGVVKEASFPIALVLVYGAFFTLLLALAFAPAQLSLLAAGRRIRDLVTPLPAVDSEDFDEVHKKWKGVGELMGLETSTSEVFQSGAAILAPLTSAMVSVLLPT